MDQGKQFFLQHTAEQLVLACVFAILFADWLIYFGLENAKIGIVLTMQLPLSSVHDPERTVSIGEHLS